MPEAVSQPTSADLTAEEAQTRAEQDAAALAADATRGWAAFRNAVNVELPQLLNRAEDLHKTTMRVLGG